MRSGDDKPPARRAHNAFGAIERIREEFDPI
jgi:hypothetical protein